MARTKATPAVLDEPHPELEEPLRRLDGAQARWQREQAEEVEELREAWAPQVARARALIGQLEALERQHAPLVSELAQRRFEGIPTGGLNHVARIEALTREIQLLWRQPAEDLRRLVTEVEGLRPETVARFQNHTEAFHFYLQKYPHTPAGIASAVKALIHTVETLAQQLDTDAGEPSTPLRQLPPAPLLIPEVEMMV